MSVAQLRSTTSRPFSSRSATERPPELKMLLHPKGVAFCLTATRTLSGSANREGTWPSSLSPCVILVWLEALEGPANAPIQNNSDPAQGPHPIRPSKVRRSDIYLAPGGVHGTETKTSYRRDGSCDGVDHPSGHDVGGGSAELVTDLPP